MSTATALSEESRIDQWRKKFNDLTPRERVLIAGTFVVLVLALLYLLVIEPKQKKTTAFLQEIAQQQQAIRAREGSLVVLNRALTQDPSAPVRRNLEDLTSRDLSTSDRIAKESGKLIDPTQMNRVLESVLAQSPGLRLVSLKTLPIERLDLLGATTQADKNSTKNVQSPSTNTSEPEVDVIPVYEHPFELKVSGSYAAVYQYLHRLEQLSRAFFWDGLELKVDEYPQTEVILRIHTLSGEEGWLGG